MSLKRFVISAIIFSLAAAGLIFYLVYGRSDSQHLQDQFLFLPLLNATLNGLSAICLVFGFVAIKNAKPTIHKRWMLSAFFFSSLFLVSYLLHHYLHGDSKFLGHGAIRPIYFFLLLTHILLSGVALPLILVTFFLSLTGRLPLHKKVARFTFPIWLYVGVTGVLVYVLYRGFGTCS